VSRLEAWALHLATILVGGTGLIYAWMIYLAKPADPYSLVHHPWQPHLQHLHLLFAPLLVFAAGLIWRRHVWAKWRSGVSAARRSGLTLGLSLAPMVLSGYLVQTAVDDSWRKIWGVVHLAVSGLWVAGYLVHQVLAFRLRGK
jgi:hypothetical protein